MNHHMGHGTGSDDMAMPTGTSAMAMPSSTSDMSHGDMGGMTMSMADMVMVFFTSSRTPLFSESWIPSNTGEYAGTCIFLIALACILRVLLALKPILESRFWQKPTTVVTEHVRSSTASEEMQEKLVPRQALRRVGQDVGRGWAGWRVGASAARATYEMLIVGVGYLLMLAVMTMNVGYFLSVLGGAWLGTFFLGELAADSQPSHC